MKFSENWLREFINPPLSTEQLIEQLTMLGLEVDALQVAAPPLKHVTVAQVLEIKPHPNADKLNICDVDDGSGTVFQVICGATNVKTGGRYPYAKMGALLPGNIEIKKTKLKGEESVGMLCSEAELGISEDSSGLMELPTDAPVGQNIQEYLQLEDQLIEIDLTPNRGDCLSIVGVAREIAAVNHLNINKPDSAVIAGSIRDTVSIDIQVPAACPRYAGRIVRNINPHAKTPIWMVERLRRSGIRSIHPVVDISNYVMLEIGQPMHGFDLQKLTGGIIVRMAKEAESIALLNGTTIELKANTLVIADQHNACAVAGIMGGEMSAVSDLTTNILFESAFFSPDAIAGRARQYGLHTDSSHRFERGVDYQLQIQAIEKATALLLEISGGQAGPVKMVEHTAYLPECKTIRLRKSRIKRVLGASFEDQFVVNCLSSLGLILSSHDEGWDAKPPSYRFDLSCETDLIEELARIRGYAQIPRTLSVFAPDIHVKSESDSLLNVLDSILINKGYQEIISYSFIDPRLQHLLDPEQEPLVLTNPISSEMSAMRTNLWPGLVSALKYNLNRQQKRLQLYEKGLRFIAQPTNLKQEMVISGLRYGNRYEEHWDNSIIPTDFYDIKGDIEALLGLRLGSTYYFEPCQHPVLHPGQAAKIVSDECLVGHIGAIHPKIAKELELESVLFMFELNLAAFQVSELPHFKEVSKFTRNRRDLSVVVDQDVSWAEIERVVRATAPKSLQEVLLFDIYRGKTLTSGRKSIAMGLILQEISRTLTDKEMDAVIDRVLASLHKNLGATLRE